MTTTSYKDPDATLDWKWDWSAAAPGPYLEAGETIATSQFIVPDGLTVVSSTHDDTTATVWLSGGTAGVRYPVTNRVTTTAGRTDDWTLPITVQNR